MTAASIELEDGGASQPREVEAGALVALPLAGVNLTRPIGIIQRRGKELGRTATRFMQLLVAQPGLTNGIAQEHSPDFEIGDADELETVETNGSLAANKRVQA